MANIAILGTGTLSTAIACDLASTHDVTVLDNNKAALSLLSKKQSKIETINENIFEIEDYSPLLEPFDLVISVVSGFIGFETMKKVLTAKKDIIELSLFPENCFDLDYLAKKNEVTAIVDCSLSPGMSNIILGYLDSKIEVKKYECLIGELPIKCYWPFNFQSPSSPFDIIDDLNRPARYVENSELVVKESFSDCEVMNIRRVGSLEAFNSDGLRTLLQTMDHIPNMKDKTMRYPGHAEYMNVLKNSGFFSKEELDVGGLTFRPIDVTAKILQNSWQLKSSDEEFTVLRITIDGEENNKNRRYIYRMLDKGDTENNISSIARTSGYTATAVANYFLQNPLEPGICVPEILGSKPGAYEYILEYLKDRGLDYRIEDFTLEN